jgi:hypothetical protein
MKSSLFSALKSALGTKHKDDAGRSPHPGTVTNAPNPQHPPYFPTANAVMYPSAPASTAPMYAPPLSRPGYPNSPAPATPPALSPAGASLGLTAGGMPLTIPAAFRAVLGFADLRWIGLQPTRDEPEVSVEDGNGVSAIWTHDTDTQGGIELDLFRAAANDPAKILETIVKAGDGKPAPAQIGGADQAYEAQTDQYSWLAARRGPLVFVLSIPSSPQASQQLGYLGGLVLTRVIAG